MFFRNHLTGQDLLHVDVYDEDSIIDEKIGSIQIDLHQLYQKGFFLFVGRENDFLHGDF